MISLILGGSGSGKSEYAESVVVKNATVNSKKIYIATMQPFGEEAKEKIERHHELRREKGFYTIEKYVDLGEVIVEEENSIILLECLSNLLANEIYAPSKEVTINVVDKIKNEVKQLEKRCNHLVIVSNDIFSSGEQYEEETMLYLEQLGKLNEELGKMANQVVEVVCGIEILLKSEEV